MVFHVTFNNILANDLADNAPLSKILTVLPLNVTLKGGESS
jgi:hypothetical protein